MMHRLIVIVALATALSASAQKTRTTSSRKATASKAAAVQATPIETPPDTLDVIAADYAAQITAAAARTRTGTGAAVSLTNPYYYPLFTGATAIPYPLSYTIGSITTPPAGTFTPHHINLLAHLLADTYARQPWLVSRSILTPTESPVDSITATPVEAQRQAYETARRPTEISHDDVTASIDDDDVIDLSDLHIHIRRPNFWRFKSQMSAQFLQYYVTPNWYKGGDNYLSMLGQLQIEANYDNHQRVTFSNKLEAKLGFQTSPNDEFHKFKTNNDLLRMTNKLGIRAKSRWYYTAMLQSWTQFYPSYNRDVVRSSFMSPFESVLSLGMDYKLDKKRVQMTINIAPLAGDFKYCHRSAIVTNHGIESGKHSKVDFGSTLTTNATIKLHDMISYVTRLYAFYDYRGHVKAEWENTINFKVNKYLSTKLFLYPRFDNNVKKKSDDDSYFQFNEYLSVGLDLSF